MTKERPAEKSSPHCPPNKSGSISSSQIKKKTKTKTDTSTVNRRDLEQSAHLCTDSKEGPSSSDKRVRTRFNEIDEIFSIGKKKKTNSEVGGKLLQERNHVEKGSIQKKRQSSSSIAGKGWIDPPKSGRKKTGDGYTVYSADEIGFGKADAGGTPLCPFDCNCCF